MKKIAIIVKRLNIKGGTQRQSLALAFELNKRGYEVVLYTFLFSKKDTFEELLDGIKVVSLSLGRDNYGTGIKRPYFDYLFKIYQENEMSRRLALMIDKDTDILNPHDQISYKVATYFKKYVKNIPSVWTMNDIPSRSFGYWKENKIDSRIRKSLFTRLFYFLVDLIENWRFVSKQNRIIVLDEWNKGIVYRYFRKKADVVRSGVDIEKFSFQKRKPLNDRTVFLFMNGIFFPHRRFEDAMYTVKILIDKGFDIKLRIAGDYENNKKYFEKLKKLGVELIVEDRVIFLGKMSELDLINEYKKNDIFIFPNYLQTWGLAVFEAMASGMPVIVSRGAGAHEVLTHCKNAIIINSKSPEEIVDAVVSMIDDKELFSKIGHDGREFVEKNMSWGKYTDEMLRVFEEEFKKPKMIKDNNNFSFSKKFISGEAHYGFWNLIAKGFGFGNTFFIIASLTLYQYGGFRLLLSFYGLLSDSIGLGGGVVGNDIVRFVGEKKEDKAKKLFYEYNRLRVFVGISLWAIVFFGAPILSFKYQPDFINFLQILSFLILSETLLAILRSLLKLRLTFAAIASQVAVNRFLQFFILLLFFTFSNIGIKEVLISLLVAHFLSTIYLLPAAFKAHRHWENIKLSKEKILFKLFASYGKWEIFRQFLSKFTNRIKPWLIKLFVSTEAVAVYGVATSMVDVFDSLSKTNTLATLIPRRIHDKEQSRKIFTYGIKYFTFFSFILMLAGLVIAPIAINLFFKQYIVSLAFFYILMLGIVIQPFWRMVDMYLVTLRKQKFFFARTFSRSILSFVLLLLLLPIFGLWGVVFIDIFIPLSMVYVGYRYLVNREPWLKPNLKLLSSFTKEDKEIIKAMYGNFISLFKAKFHF